jgi:diguanylate cyclase (GGDEF)-like protein
MWSVGAHLSVIVAVVVLVFTGVGLVLGHETWDNAQQNVRSSAASLADVGARTIAENTQVIADQTAAVATNPDLPKLYDDPTGCTFDFHLADLPKSHLDVLRPDGTVICSSAPLRKGRSSHADAAWMRHLPTALEPSGTFTDHITGQRAVAWVAPVEGPKGQRLGFVAVVVPTRSIAEPLAHVFGGRHYQFALLEARGLRTVSLSNGISRAIAGQGGDATTDPMGHAGYLSGSHAVARSPWVLVAGANPDDVMGATRSVLMRGLALAGFVMVVLLASIAVVSRKITRPLRQLSDAVGDTGPDLDEVLGSIGGPREVARLAAEFRTANATRQAYESQLSHQALHDPLTGLPNRALLAERLAEALERATRDGVTVAVLFLDLDRFKLVNDSLGHEIGDHVLVTTAGRLLDAVPAGAMLARFGGDEFVVVAEIADDTMLHGLVDDLLAAVDAPITTAEDVVRITASIGIAISAPERRPADLLRDADNAMYSAKEHGRGRAAWFNDHLHDRVSARLTMASELRVALERGELHVVYQPKIDLSTGDVIGVEALVRWEHPALGSVPPGTFIPIAEETDVIVEMGRFVLDTACRQAVVWGDDGIDITVAVNISGRQIGNGDLPAVIADVLARSGLEPERLCLELTESLLMSDTIATQRTLEDLSALGVRLSIDDFGTGYSSLAYIHRFPVDELKIDRSFMSSLSQSTSGAPLVTAMIAMGKALGLTIVAEGVETLEQEARLRSLGCDEAQGFLFARPQRPESLGATLRRPTASVAQPR